MDINSLLAIINYAIPILTTLVALCAIEFSSRAHSTTKWLCVVAAASVLYLLLHNLYMNSDHRLPEAVEFAWRGLHLIQCAIGLNYALVKLKKARKKLSCFIQTSIDFKSKHS